MTDTKSMKIKFKNALVFGWKEVLTVVIALMMAATVYSDITHRIEDSAERIEEVSELQKETTTRQLTRSSYVDQKFIEVNDNINRVRMDLAVSQSNQANISKQLDKIQDLLLSGRAQPALYKTGGSN